MPFSLALPYAIMLATLPANAQQESVHQSGEVDLIQTGEDRHQRLTVPVSIGAAGPLGQQFPQLWRQAGQAKNMQRLLRNAPVA